MTISALIENLNTAYKQKGVESDSQVKIKLPEGKIVNLKDCKIIEKNNFGKFHQVILNSENTDRDLINRVLIKALAVAFDSYYMFRSHVEDDAIVWTKPDGNKASILLGNLEFDLDRKIKELENK